MIYLENKRMNFGNMVWEDFLDFIGECDVFILEDFGCDEINFNEFLI